MNPQLGNSFSDGPHITGVPFRQSFDAHQNTSPCPDVPKIIKPFNECLCFSDFYHTEYCSHLATDQSSLKQGVSEKTTHYPAPLPLVMSQPMCSERERTVLSILSGGIPAASSDRAGGSAASVAPSSCDGDNVNISSGTVIQKDSTGCRLFSGTLSKKSLLTGRYVVTCRIIKKTALLIAPLSVVDLLQL